MCNSGSVEVRIVERLGIIKDTTPNGWARELNIVSWNGAEPKYDLREWDFSHEKMTRGITMTESEAFRLMEILKERFEK